MNTDIESRVRRIKAAIGATIERDLSSVTAQSMPTGLMFNIRGPRPDEDLANAAHSAIYNVAHLRDHLRAWFKAKRLDPELVDHAIRDSLALQVVVDLSNTDKHGNPRRGGGWSRRYPRLGSVTRGIQIHADPIQQESSITFKCDGSAPVVTGNIDLAIIADVVDGQGVLLGDLQSLLTAALSAWEALIERNLFDHG